MSDVFNFSAGPSMLPVEVLDQVQAELRDWSNLKVSVMEISHRSVEFKEIAENMECDLRILLNIPNNYRVLFFHGGARTQFSSIPMNLLGSSYFIADYIHSGYWSYSAACEAKKYCKLNLIDVNVLNQDNIRTIQDMKFWKLSSDSAYMHYCPNETIDGIAIHEVPFFNDDVIVVGDFSSVLLSEPLDVSRFGLIYAAAQKNIGISGLTIVIIRDDLLDRSCRQVPSLLKYSVIDKYKSMFNTPSTFSWYIAKLVLQWIRKKGGLSNMKVQNREKSRLLYETIDSSDYYYNNIAPSNRSYMNVPFYLKDKRLDEIFLRESHNVGLYALKGHQALGGMRASLYNAMPLKGVKILSEFMKWFLKKYG